MRNAHDPQGPTLLQPRWALSWLRGPLTELRQALDARKDRSTPQPPDEGPG
jgi:hypothetical protein